MRLRKLAHVALSALVAVGVVSCSDDSDTAGEESTPTTGSPSTGASAPTTATDPATVPARPSSGCRRGDNGAPGEITSGFRAARRRGQYIEHLPPMYDGAVPLPLVVDLHGYTEPIEFHRQVSDLSTLGDSEAFITVTPAITREIRRWDTATGSGDMRFLEALLDHLAARRCVDEARVYVTGYSNGGLMSSAMACEFPGRIAAVAPVAGVQHPPSCDPDRAVPLIAFHGTADTFLPFDGGLGPGASALPTPGGGTIGTDVGDEAFPSVPEVIGSWAEGYGCADPSTEQIGEDVGHLTYHCPAGAEVELYRVDGGGHAWPGSEALQAVESVVGHTTSTIDASALMWEFFAAHPLTG